MIILSIILIIISYFMVNNKIENSSNQFITIIFGIVIFILASILLISHVSIEIYKLI